MHFSENENFVEAIFKFKDQEKKLKFNKLLLGCGTIQTTKIVCKSLSISGKIKLHHNPFSASIFINKFKNLKSPIKKLDYLIMVLPLKRKNIVANYSLT